MNPDVPKEELPSESKALERLATAAKGTRVPRPRQASLSVLPAVDRLVTAILGPLLPAAQALGH